MSNGGKMNSTSTTKWQVAKTLKKRSAACFSRHVQKQVKLYWTVNQILKVKRPQGQMDCKTHFSIEHGFGMYSI